MSVDTSGGAGVLFSLSIRLDTRLDSLSKATLSLSSNTADSNVAPAELGPGSDGGEAQGGGGVESSTEHRFLFFPSEDDEREGDGGRDCSVHDITLLNKRDRDKTVVIHHMASP
ncbi:hypothetical protein E2C01_063595 [Portunus trituberculatus]|uniref:Uncharacterized protein n=1 Tax=Portunus trituberculatus TaxID=210409 RepID=A0A5B7HGS2_PORTR|nr:hypothetical protein [Portunus trituberculatus]